MKPDFKVSNHSDANFPPGGRLFAIYASIVNGSTRFFAQHVRRSAAW